MILGRQADYEKTHEELYEDLVDRITKAIQLLDIQSRSDNFDFNGKEERIFAKQLLQEILDAR